jgi:hypothetical protein
MNLFRRVFGRFLNFQRLALALSLKQLFLECIDLIPQLKALLLKLFMFLCQQFVGAKLAF